jgi:hypothetical protein
MQHTYKYDYMITYKYDQCRKSCMLVPGSNVKSVLGFARHAYCIVAYPHVPAAATAAAAVPDLKKSFFVGDADGVGAAHSDSDK